MTDKRSKDIIKGRIQEYYYHKQKLSDLQYELEHSYDAFDAKSIRYDKEVLGGSSVSNDTRLAELADSNSELQQKIDAASKLVARIRTDLHLDELPAIERKLLDLIYGNGMTYEEAADAIGLSKSQVYRDMVSVFEMIRIRL